MQNATATYSPEDNKLRLYTVSRLDAETYARVKAAGFSWAPKQELFVAPMWTPGREDLLSELAGEIQDEDKGLIERAEERAERFEDYSDNRKADGERANAHVEAIAGNIPLGQPILVGHHSERHARRDAKRIENGMRKAVAMWGQSQYWADRAKGALRSAKYKELPAVRARRIKKIEADLRGSQRTVAQYQRPIRFWSGELVMVNKETGAKRNLPVDYKSAVWFTGTDSCHLSYCFPLADYPRQAPASQYEGQMGLYSALGGSDGEAHAIITVEQAKTLALRTCERVIANQKRWIAHYENRLTYERAMLAEDGGLESDKTRPEKGGGCRCWASPSGGWSLIQKVNRVSVTLLDNWGNGGRNFTRVIPFDKLSALMSKAEVDQARADGRLRDTQDGTGFALLRDTPPAPIAQPVVKDPAEGKVEAMRASLKAGVQTVSAPQLFPTPDALA